MFWQLSHSGLFAFKRELLWVRFKKSKLLERNSDLRTTITYTDTIALVSTALIFNKIDYSAALESNSKLY